MHGCWQRLKDAKEGADIEEAFGGYARTANGNVVGG
jgi:hypothetical protein